MLENGRLQLTVEKLSFSFTHLPLFKEISFKAQAGEVVQLSGANGAGKSTCLSIIAGFRNQTTGSIELRDDENQQVSLENEREYLAAEANSLYYDMDAISNLLFWQQLKKRKASERSELIKTLRYWGLGKRIVYQDFAVKNFSTGMKRRLALARVQCSPSKLWLLDEPLYGLDAKGVDLFKDLITKHKADGGICVMISHDTRGFENLIHQQIPIFA